MDLAQLLKQDGDADEDAGDKADLDVDQGGEEEGGHGHHKVRHGDLSRVGVQRLS